MTELRSQIEETQPIEQKQTGKAVPFPVKRGWVGVPNSIYTVYSKHPGMNWRDAAVYAYLLINHNDKYDYAYPSQVKMAIDLGVSLPTIKRSVKSLSDLDLIEIVYSSKYNGNQYYFNPVCETIEELVGKFPGIKEHVAKLDAQASVILATGEEDKARQRRSFRSE